MSVPDMLWQGYALTGELVVAKPGPSSTGSHA